MVCYQFFNNTVLIFSDWKLNRFFYSVPQRPVIKNWCHGLNWRAFIRGKDRTCNNCSIFSILCSIGYQLNSPFTRPLSHPQRSSQWESPWKFCSIVIFAIALRSIVIAHTHTRPIPLAPTPVNLAQRGPRWTKWARRFDKSFTLIVAKSQYKIS